MSIELHKWLHWVNSINNYLLPKELLPVENIYNHQKTFFLVVFV